MNPYEEILGQFVDRILAERDAEVESPLVHQKLVQLMQTKIKDIATSISNNGNHAGRTVPCYFDVERTFQMMGIQVEDLESIRNAQSQKPQQEVIPFSTLEVRDEDVHTTPRLDFVQERGHIHQHHIPKHLPPYPNPHTYKNNRMEVFTDRTYVPERERLAQNRLSTRKALNSFYLRTELKMSLFTESPGKSEFMVLSPNVPKKPAYLAALMPNDEVFDKNIYDFKDPPNDKALKKPFLKEPRVLSPNSIKTFEGEKCLELSDPPNDKALKNPFLKEPRVLSPNSIKAFERKRRMEFNMVDPPNDKGSFDWNLQQSQEVDYQQQYLEKMDDQEEQQEQDEHHNEMDDQEGQEEQDEQEEWDDDEEDQEMDNQVDQEEQDEEEDSDDDEEDQEDSSSC